jgi:hypothetical protein
MRAPTICFLVMIALELVLMARFAADMEVEQG